MKINLFFFRISLRSVIGFTVSILLLALLTESFAPKPYERNFKLVYENDAQGKCLHGSIKDLILAIQSGNEIRIYWQDQDSTKKELKTAHLAVSEIITILNDQTVLAQIDPVIEQRTVLENSKTKFKENLKQSLMVSTRGNQEEITQNALSGEIIAHKIEKNSMKWFIKKP